MTTITAHIPAHVRLRTCPAPTEPLLQLHSYLFPERYADVDLMPWTATTAADAARLVAQLLAEGPRPQIAAALRDVADELTDVDDLGPADTLDAAAAVLEAACTRLAVTGFVAL